MRRARALLAITLVAACTPSNGDIVGPFTGTPHRFVVDSFQLPQNNTQARQLGDELDGQGYIDNQTGIVIGMLAAGRLDTGDLTPYGPEMIASGALLSSIIIQADDLGNDPHAGVTFYGADGDASTVMGGNIVDGVFSSNRTRTTRVPGAASVRLPLFVDTAPSVFVVEGMEIDLMPDGSGGYDGLVRGGISGDYMDVVANGLYAMIVADIAKHPYSINFFGGEYRLSVMSIASNELMQSLLAQDVRVLGQLMLSIGFGVHLSPCDAGNCAPSPPADHCHDRIVDADETDLDCGGPTCGPCTAAHGCNAGSDCESKACDAGMCRAPTCADGVKDGLETDVDCGWNCPGCAKGQVCFFNDDCATGLCSGGCHSTDTYSSTCTIGVCL